MILSVSRRTDIPAFYSDWFFNRLDDGYVLVRNPMNIHQVSRILLLPDVVDCIVFWSKNPQPMLSRLSEIEKYHYYFQFTLNAYGLDLEEKMPPLSERIATFKTLAERIGPDRVIWRYDPIIVTDIYSVQYHIEQFEQLARELHSYTKRCTISFVDVYRKLQSNFRRLEIRENSNEEMLSIATSLSRICKEQGITLETCAEKMDLSFLGIEHAHCIDEKLISSIIGEKIDVSKDKNQRAECGCVSSIDIGQYNTCPNGCAYCYANYNTSLTERNYRDHDPKSPLLIGSIEKGDKITERKMASQIIVNRQMKLDDL